MSRPLGEQNSSLSSKQQCKTAVVHAQRVLAALRGESFGVEKTIWASPAGKKHLAARLSAMLPAHRVYVEPFAGSAAVLFAKEPAEIEVIGDLDREIADAYQTIKTLTPAKLERLRKMKWIGDKSTFKSLRQAQPKDDIERLHRFLYLTHFSFGKMRGSGFTPFGNGVAARTTKRIERYSPRLKNVTIYSGDYEKFVKKYDSPATVFFFDPPYVGYDAAVGEAVFDEERFLKVLKSIKGKFLLTYGIQGRLPGLLRDTGYRTQRIRSPGRIGRLRQSGNASIFTQIIATNYDLEKKRASFSKSLPIIKGIDPNDERYVLGIVLEPEVVDAQGDIYSALEIRQAAHRFMEEYGHLGLMHKFQVNGEVKILESYLAPTDFSIDEVRVQKGTWLLAVRIISDEFWKNIKEGNITGFSIGGSARVVSDNQGGQDAGIEARL